MPDPKTAQRLIDERRQDKAFMDRIAHRVKEDAALLDRLKDSEYDGMVCPCCQCAIEDGNTADCAQCGVLACEDCIQPWDDVIGNLCPECRRSYA